MATLELMEIATLPLVLELAIHLQAQTEFLMDIKVHRTDTLALKVSRTGIKDHPMVTVDHNLDILDHQMGTLDLLMDILMAI